MVLDFIISGGPVDDCFLVAADRNNDSVRNCVCVSRTREHRTDGGENVVVAVTVQVINVTDVIELTNEIVA